MTKQHALILALILACAFRAHSQEKLQIKVASGISIQDFSWSIAGNADGTNPNILSELKYQNIVGLGLSVDGKYKILPKMSVMLTIENRQTLSGTGSDIDYQHDNRTTPTYELHFNSSKGGMQHLQTGLAYNLYKDPFVTVDANVSYINTSQTFSMTSSSAPNLDTWYSTRQQGIQVGTFFHTHLGSKLQALATLSYALVDYTGIGNWNLIPTFEHPVSFMQESNGSHYRGSIGLIRSISSLLSFYISGGYAVQKVRAGTDQTFLRNGLRQITRFNGAKGSNLRVNFGVILSP
ncbi:hypothetical protein [Sphingobacterium griseoflavum]|uniref:Protochlamydia outer membrane protein domain-containing protein n=1 Tax=Sphingobacterium griseoflavum TaxID=1474952 RepID=A0ABQ3HUI7_9SPHI|nr:hypothetical protein [Sphingobacterium griseoflavum]GHE23842.1 hypothetical protein GCM10017764_08100 [Sphingobacterium griseoflavum]